MIVSMHPKYRRKAEKAKGLARKNGEDGTNGETKDLRARKFPGLSLPDQDLAIPLNDSPLDKSISSSLPQVDVNDTMAELAAVASRRNRPMAEDYLDGEPSSKRVRQSEEGVAGPSRPNGNSYTSRLERNGHSSQAHGRSRLDHQPILYKIYDGAVQNIRDFGAFVSLEGIQGRAEGENEPPVPPCLTGISQEWSTFPTLQEREYNPQARSSNDGTRSKSRSCPSPAVRLD